uniref:Protein DETOXIFICATION n=1 Tax=Ananas comosus var. bracteatus TaxID=296719 RepID=A0A6V7PXP0_ANACO|nr:unnamed protein product [Ananas comosus var. bracteatus]
MCHPKKATSSANELLLTAPIIGKLKPPPAAAAFAEAGAILGQAVPMILTGLILYLRSMISMLFLGRLGGLALAGGSLAIGFANITGYSVLSGWPWAWSPSAGRPSAPAATRCWASPCSAPLFSCSAPASPSRRSGRTCGRSSCCAGRTRPSPPRPRPTFSTPSRTSSCSPSSTRSAFTSARSPSTCRSPSAPPPPSSSTSPSTTSSSPSSGSASGRRARLRLRQPQPRPAAPRLRPPLRRAQAHGGFALSAESFRGWGPLLALSLPSAASVCLEWWWYEIMILLCGLLADPQATVASMGILIQTTSLIYIFPSSLSFGVSTRVANELGANRPHRARRAANVGLACGFALGFAALSFAVSVRRVWARMFTADAAILQLTASALPILGCASSATARRPPGAASSAAARGQGRRQRQPGVVLRGGMPVAVGLAFWAGLDFRGLWLGLLSAQAACVVLMLAVIKTTDWDAQADRAQALTGAASDSGGAAFLGSDEKEALLQPKPAAVGGDEKTSLVITIQTDPSS